MSLLRNLLRTSSSLRNVIGSYSREAVFSSVDPPEFMGLWGITQTKFTEAMTSTEKSTLSKYLLLS